MRTAAATRIASLRWPAPAAPRSCAASETAPSPARCSPPPELVERELPADAETVIDGIAARLQGYEIDPFAAWISRAAVDAVLWGPDALLPSDGIKPILGDALAAQEPSSDAAFDLVIGNPPCGRIGLCATQRERYRRSLYGHANLYGVFTGLALRHTKPGGIVAFVTPSSFLAGRYFQNLRRLLADEAPPASWPHRHTQQSPGSHHATPGRHPCWPPPDACRAD